MEKFIEGTLGKIDANSALYIRVNGGYVITDKTGEEVIGD